MTTHKSLAEALCAFQAAAPTLPKDSTNPHFKSRFTSLDTIGEKIRPLLAEHGLTWSTYPTIVEGRPALRYELGHVSGDVRSDTMPLLLTKEDSQGLGSAITYARRYAVTAVLNLVADEDDDGNTASRPTSNGASRAQAQPVAHKPENGNGERAASAKQRGLINVRASEAGMGGEDLAKAVLRACGQPEREFESPESALAFVNRQLDRLPARLVDPVLAEIAGASS